MEMGEFRHPVYTLDSKADINYGEAQVFALCPSSPQFLHFHLPPFFSSFAAFCLTCLPPFFFAFPVTGSQLWFLYSVSSRTARSTSEVVRTRIPSMLSSTSISFVSGSKIWRSCVLGLK